MLQPDGSFIGAQACAFPRSAMPAGQPVTQGICFQEANTTNLYSMLPSDLDGSTPLPSGEPNFYLSLGIDAIMRLYRFHVDFTTTSNSTFTGPFSIANVAAFSEGCSRICVPQPGTTQLLDALGDRVMYRLAYRNFGSYESLVANQTVQVTSSSNQNGVRWYEIRNPNGTPTVFQQGTYSPDSTAYRWLGSLAQDRNGDVAVGYSVSDPVSIYPGIRYAGRLVSDPLGTLEAESVIVNGSASQTGQHAERWGDYSSMSIDPTDDCTFWYTNEYIAVGGSWNTRIASFKFNGCGVTSPPPTPSGITATPGNGQVNLSWNPSSGANSYNLFRSVNGGTYSSLNTNPITTTSYGDNGLTKPCA
jgi:hypothetical protein